MSSKEKRRSIFDEIFGGPSFEEFKEISGLDEGYSISIIQTPEGTEVDVKAGKDMDVGSLRKELERRYPGAKIKIEGGRSRPLIREIEEDDE